MTLSTLLDLAAKEQSGASTSADRLAFLLFEEQDLLKNIALYSSDENLDCPADEPVTRAEADAWIAEWREDLAEVRTEMQSIERTL